ncbi:Tumor necrosis factor receptor superfamily member 13B [Collichthys lucidus]|uniref:Tumor necrosis factor receptor superfamily member 13B n=1 Tax=Collichthys lucidus TaxID=240159 RepID=A0A4U5VNQ4_COLLU|nr:Tumor necrosis factor receptor superfamily member 13B [Collichthys lucidus]
MLPTLITYNRGIMETVLKSCITALYGYCNTFDCKTLQVIQFANCKAQSGHFYDDLLKDCMRCTAVCGQHPVECSKHCQRTPITVTTKKLQVEVTSPMPYSRGLSVPTALGDSTIVLYPLLALCMLLLFSSLFLALVVFLRGARTKTSKLEPKEANHNQECVVQLGQEVGQPGSQLGQSSKDVATNSSRPADREPSDDSSPTETCVCVHCFPDLKALGQGNDKLVREPFPFYPQAVPHRAQIQNNGYLWNGVDLYTSVRDGPEEAAVG